MNAKRLLVHRDPCRGKYNSVAAYSPLETVSPLAAPDAALRVAELLPEQQ